MVLEASGHYNELRARTEVLQARHTRVLLALGRAKHRNLLESGGRDDIMLIMVQELFWVSQPRPRERRLWTELFP